MKKLALVFFALVLGMTGFASGAKAGETIVSQPVPQTLSNGASDYWTKDKMEKARPHPGPAKKGNRPSPGDSAIVPQADGLPGSVKSGAPEKISRQGASLARPDDPLTLLASPGSAAGITALGSVTPLAVGYDYPPPQTTFKVLSALYGSSTDSVFPYMAVGRVFFSDATDNYSCTGAAIGNRAVLTAGHCVSDGAGKFFKNWVFVPSYKNGAAPYGKWSATEFLVFDAYHTDSEMGRDVAFAVVKDISGKKLAQKVGFLGFKYNQTRILHWNMFGYPVGSPFNGKLLIETQASVSVTDTSCKPSTSGAGTRQTSGSSGGPWLKDFVPEGSGNCNYANGVVSYHYTDEPYEVYTPFFDGQVNTLRAKAVAK